MNTSNLQLIVDLNDGTTLVGTFVSIAHDVPAPQCSDAAIHESPQAVWTLTIRSATLGRLDVDARHVVRIGPSQMDVVDINNPEDVGIYLDGLFRLAGTVPLNRL